ncbi:MAG: hypothetical protein WA902_07075 [Thermosynechococcaceae cyanobacterium]
MKWRSSIPFSFIFLAVVTLPSFAGSSYVENSYKVRSIFNGESKTKIDIKEVYEGVREAGSSAVKREWGTTSVAESRDGRNFLEKDRFDVTTKSYSQERGNFLKTTNVSIRESYDFSGFEKNHRVSSGFDF